MTKEEFINTPMNDELAQLIREMLSVTQQCTDYAFEMYGVTEAPISHDDIQQLEERTGIHLPEDYKWFLSNVGVIHRRSIGTVILQKDGAITKVDDRDMYLCPLQNFNFEIISSTKKACAFDSWVTELTDGVFINWFKAKLFDDWVKVSKILTLPQEIKISKPERIRVGGRKVNKIVPLEQTLVEKYQKWYKNEWGEEPDLGNGHFDDSQLEFIADFLWDTMADMQMPGGDLGKVEFDTENIDFSSEDANTEDERNFLGFHTLPNGVEFLGIVTGGDWEAPLWLILYHDGRKLRGYIPSNGNTYNTDYNTAFGSELNTEKANTPDYAYKMEFSGIIVEWAKRRGYLPMDAPDYELELVPDFDLMMRDITSRIELTD